LVVAATSGALDALRGHFAAKELVLVGYSGGGAVAALAAAQRQDVARLITLAGNLDHPLWTREHRLTPLSGSLNPADLAPALAGIPQWHFSGGRDRVIPPAIAASFAARSPANPRLHLKLEPEFDHHCCWTTAWPRLWQETEAGP
jgi:pimeloyl-ACP methyl ester carboxylesterase